MWSKLLMFTVAVVFLAALGTGVTAHDGRISNIILEPEEVDEHPWGGEHELIDEPQLAPDPTFNPYGGNIEYLFIRIAIKHYWLNVKDSFRDLLNPGEIDGGTITNIQNITTSSDNNTYNNDQGARNK